MISEQEKRKRRQALRDAEAICETGLPGVQVGDYAKQVYEKFIEGEIEKEDALKLLIEEAKSVGRIDTRNQD